MTPRLTGRDPAASGPKTKLDSTPKMSAAEPPRERRRRILRSGAQAGTEQARRVGQRLRRILHTI